MNELIKALIALFIGGILGGLIKKYYDFRRDVVKSIWDRRFEEYKKLWKISSVLPKWPKDDSVTYMKLYACCVNLKDWYFDAGGMLLSKNSRNKYQDLQTALSVLANKKTNDKITDKEYEDIRSLFSALRTQMTRDLTSRNRQILR